ncbi:hypothetical protein ABTX20_005518, partial [Salmonella enterica]
MKQTMTRAVVGLLLGHAACCTAEVITVPTPDPRADFLRADLKKVGHDAESLSLIDDLKLTRADPTFRRATGYLIQLDIQPWLDAGFTNGMAISAYSMALHRQVTIATLAQPTCQTSQGCNSEDVRKNLSALLSETRKAQTLYADVKRVDDVLNGRTHQSPLTSESNIDASYVTDKRTYKMTADDN